MRSAAYDAFQEGNRLLASENPHARGDRARGGRVTSSRDKASVRETLAARPTSGSGRFAQAREEFERAVEIEPVNDYAHFGLGLCLIRKGDELGARRHLKLAVAMRPDQPDYRATLARVAEGRRDRPMTASPVVACRLDRRRRVARATTRSRPRPTASPRCGPPGCGWRSCRERLELAGR